MAPIRRCRCRCTPTGPGRGQFSHRLTAIGWRRRVLPAPARSSVPSVRAEALRRRPFGGDGTPRQAQARKRRLGLAGVADETASCQALISRRSPCRSSYEAGASSPRSMLTVPKRVARTPLIALPKGAESLRETGLEGPQKPASQSGWDPGGELRPKPRPSGHAGGVRKPRGFMAATRRSEKPTLASTKSSGPWEGTGSGSAPSRPTWKLLFDRNSIT
jgi:hypothetical protein